MAVKGSYYINAPVETVFDFFRSGAWTEVAMMDVHDVKVTKEGVGTHYIWDARLGPITMQSLSVWTDVRPNEHITERTTAPFSGTWEHSFQPEGSGSRYTIEFEPRSLWRVPPLRWAVERGISRMGDQMMARVRARLETSGSGGGTKRPAKRGRSTTTRSAASTTR